MRVAVTGGSGFVGEAIVVELVSSGHQVTVMARHPPKRPVPAVRYTNGNVSDGEGLDTLLEGQEALVHLVGIIREVKPDQTFEAVHRGGTENAVRAARKHRVARYLHMSALGTREGAVSRYHRTKWEAEVLVRESGLSWTIFRPSIIFGPRDAFINMFLDVMRKSPIMPVIGGGRGRLQPVYVRDVAKAFAACLVRPGTAGKVYELGGPEVFTFKELLKKTAQIAGHKRIFIPIPMLLATAPVKVAEALGIPLPVTSDQLIMLSEDNIRQGGAPLEDLGFPFTTLEDGVREYLGKI